MRTFTPDDHPPGPSGPSKIKIEPKEEPKWEPKEEFKAEPDVESMEARLAREYERMREAITSDIIGRLRGAMPAEESGRNTASACDSAHGR